MSRAGDGGPGRGAEACNHGGPDRGAQAGYYCGSQAPQKRRSKSGSERKDGEAM